MCVLAVQFPLWVMLDLTPVLPEPADQIVFWPLRQLFQIVVDSSSKVEKGICTWPLDFDWRDIVKKVDKLISLPTSAKRTRNGSVTVHARESSLFDYAVSVKLNCICLLEGVFTHGFFRLKVYESNRMKL